MNAARQSSLALAVPSVASLVRIPAIPIAAANDVAPRRELVVDQGAERGVQPSVTLPTRLTVRKRRASAVDVSISRDAVTFAAPDSSAIPDAGAASEPLSSYRGIEVTVVRDEGEPLFQLTLAHDNEAHSVPLSASNDVETIAREWQAWAKALSLPLIAIDADGTVHAELNALGVVLAERPSARRRGSPLVGRRSPYGRRRRAQAKSGLEGAAVHRGEAEIIART